MFDDTWVGLEEVYEQNKKKTFSMLPCILFSSRAWGSVLVTVDELGFYIVTDQQMYFILV